MKQYLMIATFVVFGFSGCTSSMNQLSEPTEPTRTAMVQQHFEQPSVAKTEAYENTMRKIASGIQNDPNYQRIALNTPEKKKWFRNLTYRLWDRQMTRQQFMSEGLEKEPSHKYEFDFIVRGFTFN